MKTNELDYDILKSFVPEKDKHSFMVFDSAEISFDGKSIFAPYRCFHYTKPLIIQMSDYLSKVRDSKIELLIY